jgi:FkbM family methyltransferase
VVGCCMRKTLHRFGCKRQTGTSSLSESRLNRLTKREWMIQNILDRLRWGGLSEAVSLADEIGPEVRKLVTDYAEVVSKARTSCIIATGHSILSKYLKIRSTSHFEFLKCAFYLLEKEKEAVIWQVGAADGILADPLRPLAINCDSRVVMLEPNPYMFESLKRNYGRNENIQFIQAALGVRSGKMELNAIRPEKIAAHDLPAWVAEISSFYTDRNAMAGLTIDEDLTGRIQEQVEKITVEMMSIGELLRMAGNQKPDIVVIDVEGMDGEILQSILEFGIKPKIIQYETQCLRKPEQEALAGKLSKEYVQVSFGNDLVAYRTDFFLAYCNELYIQHGIPTIYEEALKFIAR